MDQPTKQQVAIWMAMAEHFLDTETRHEIPATAQLCVEAGLSIEHARDVWCHEVSPVVSFNLMMVAGEWACWDEAWLVENVQRVRNRPRGRLRRFFDRSALRSGVWRSIERCMQSLLHAAPDNRPAMTARLSDLARHFFDFVRAPLVVTSPEQLVELTALAEVATQVLAPATVAGTYEQCCSRVREALAACRVIAHNEQVMTSELPVALPEQAIAALHAAYEQPPRAYHNFAHVREVLGHALRVPAWGERAPVLIAILFHDAIYEPSQKDNEERSAELAARSLENTEYGALIPRVQQLIRLTARHGSVDPAEVDGDAALFLDCDMAILGAPAAEYDAYEAAIAEEYRHVPAELYRQGRAVFLRKLLGRPFIYLSPFFREEREAAARANIQRALGQLSPCG